MGKRFPWTLEETILAFYVYRQLPPDHLEDPKHPDVINLSKLINHSPESIAMKMANFIHLDPSIDLDGLDSVKRKDQKVWDTYANNPELLSTDSKKY